MLRRPPGNDESYHPKARAPPSPEVLAERLKSPLRSMRFLNPVGLFSNWTLADLGPELGLAETILGSAGKAESGNAGEQDGPCGASLEGNPQCELHESRIDGSRGDLAKRGGTGVRVRIAELWIVKHVEKLCPEFDEPLFA